MIDYDRIEGWFNSLRVALSAVVTERTLSSIQNSKPNFVEDSRDTLFKFAERDAVIDATLDWLRSSTIAGYHGTRLKDEEGSSVREAGLLPLAAAKRRDRLARALSKHPDWDVAAQKLDAVLQQH